MAALKRYGWSIAFDGIFSAFDTIQLGSFYIEFDVIKARPLVRRSGRVAAVSEGLDVGDRVIVYPSDRVSDGTRIKNHPNEGPNPTPLKAIPLEWRAHFKSKSTSNSP
jgi:hypothetical protein